MDSDPRGRPNESLAQSRLPVGDEGRFACLDALSYAPQTTMEVRLGRIEEVRLPVSREAVASAEGSEAFDRVPCIQATGVYEIGWVRQGHPVLAGDSDVPDSVTWPGVIKVEQGDGPLFPEHDVADYGVIVGNQIAIEGSWSTTLPDRSWWPPESVRRRMKRAWEVANTRQPCGRYDRPPSIWRGRRDRYVAVNVAEHLTAIFGAEQLGRSSESVFSQTKKERMNGRTLRPEGGGPCPFDG